MSRQKRQKLKQRSDGRYKCKYHGIQFYGSTPEEALAAREEYKRQEAAGEYKRENPTVTDYAEKWLPLHKSDVSDKCYNDYKKQLAALTDTLGDIKIKDITVDDAAAVWRHFDGYSASTIKRAKMLYVALFDTAIENDLCIKNPFRAKFAQPPKGTEGSHRAITEEEISLIWSTPHRMQLAALIMLYCGLRRGEVLAITSKDINTKENTITVNKAIRYDSNQPIRSAPKTSAGNRPVPIPYILQPLLKDFSGRVLSTSAGKTMTETSFSRCWESYILHLSKAAGHPVNIRPHDLRHTYCTMLRDAGVDMKQAMIWMGHSDEKMILHVYDHVSEKRTQNSIDQMENLLLRVQNGVQK